MDYTALVRVLERLGDLEENRDDRQIIGTAQAAQVTTRRELHRQKERPILALGLIYLEDERMIETTGALVFVTQCVPRRRGASRCHSQDLQRDIRTTLGIMGAPHLALTASAQSFLKDVARPDQRGFIRDRRLVHDPTPMPPRRSAARISPARDPFSTCLQ